MGREGGQAAGDGGGGIFVTVQRVTLVVVCFFLLASVVLRLPGGNTVTNGPWFPLVCGASRQAGAMLGVISTLGLISRGCYRPVTAPQRLI